MMKSQYDPFCYWRMIWLLVLLMVSVSAIAKAECDYQPDATDCPCFVDVGQWDPSGGYIQDVAMQTLGNVVSCTCTEPSATCDWDPWPLDSDKNFVNSGKPYYQMVLGCDEPFTAFSMAVLLNSGAGGVEGRGAWCTEAVSYWHKHAQIPYPGGYFSDSYLDWLVPNANYLTLWYFTEETWGAGRAHWLPSSALDNLTRPLKLEDLHPGINVPTPGSYVAIRGYETTVSPSGEVIGSWKDWRETGHSQIIDEMWIHYGLDGNVCSIEATILEGNSGTPPRVRNDRKFDDILELTPLGGDMFFGDRKIFGFGVDLDEHGDPIYDSARLHFVPEQKICSLPPVATLAVFDSEWDEQYFRRIANYASLVRSNGGLSLQYSGSLNIGGIPNGTTKWYFPKGLTENVEITIDLLDTHPLPIRGVEIRWDGRSLPIGYSVKFAGPDGEYRDAVVADLTELEKILDQGQFHPQEFSVSCTFGSGGAGEAVRFVKLIFPQGTFAADAVLKELRFRYNTGLPDDAPTHPEGTHRAPDCKNAYAEPMYLWSPNHKFEKIQIKGVTDPEGSPVNIKIVGITQDEPVDSPGDAHTAPDGIIQNGTAASVRAERSGKGNGRVYEIKFIATDTEGGSSIGSVNVMVPHSKKQLPLDDGQHYDSTQQP